jgi:TPR repeat protein
VDGWLDYLAPAFGSVLSDFLDYAVHGEDYRKALDPSVYELSPNESQALADSLDGLLDRAFETLKRNSKPTDRKISKEILKKFGEALGSGDPAGVLEKLAPMEDELGFYPPYWFFRGYSLLTLGRTAEAEADFQKFEAVWRPVLVKDGMLADAAKFSLLKAISLGDEVKELKYADLIANHADKDGWINSLLAGVVYDELGDREKAEDCFQVNLDNGRGPLASGLALDYVRTGGSAAEGLREFAERKPYYDDGAREIVIVRESAAAGDPLAQYALGILTLDGVATKRDYVDAAKWLGLAASHGYARAQNALGEMCRDGRGVPVDLAKAANLFFQAADQGDAQAQANLGRLYLTGSGVGKNPAEAARWLALAAARGDMGAQATLWETYLRGEGSNRNLTEGLKWLRQAAENGSPSAQFQLGRAYDQGEGVPIDRTEALKWLRAAAEGGSAEAKLALKDR